jgi:hypothetical protein
MRYYSMTNLNYFPDVTGHGPSATASGVNSFYYCANRPKGTRIRLEALFAIVLYMGESPTLAPAPSHLMAAPKV